MSVSRLFKVKPLYLIPLTFVLWHYQNCDIGSPDMKFVSERVTLRSEGGTGGGFDGKPGNGTYCRIYDSISCSASTPNLQSVLSVDDKGIQLNQDNCTTTSTKFLFNDVAFDYSKLLPDYIGLSRGIFKKCDLSEQQSTMGETFCTSAQSNAALVIAKTITTKNLELVLTFVNSKGRRSVKIGSLSKTQNASSTTYSSNTERFDLKVEGGISQTHLGHLVTEVDDIPIDMSLECRLSNPTPTIVNEQDLEISPTWIDITRLAGYWKLNEINAGEGTSIVDSSSFHSTGTFFTGSDGFNKSVLTPHGSAISFDGTNDNILVANPIDKHLDFDNRSFSYMVWIYKTGNTGAFDMPLWKGGQSNGNAGYDIECGSSVCYANISDGTGGPSGQSIVVSPFGPDGNAFIGRWVHLTAVIDRNSQQLRTYVNGSLVGSANISAVGSVTNNFDFQIGGTQNFTYNFLGSIDDVAIWSQALTDAQVQEIFQRLRPKFF
ncbi:MAG: hypothetical protein A4S09_16125 [Proteobacteria bacterium SG_bin7]|nr:MAG: hypothetical protein A4S09_16125 [Proteobacteria bacterium SG_bin7]